MFKQVATNDIEVVVSPNEKTITGTFKSFGEDLTTKERYNLANDIKSNIQRHVDDVEQVWINQKLVWESEDGVQYDTLYEGLQDEYSDFNFGYVARYVLPSDKGVGTRTAQMAFEKMIETAYRNPWSFELVFANPPLTEEQNQFLQRVLEESLNAKESKQTA